MNNLKNKVVFVTGSSLGIGKETAFKFAGENCKVIVTYFKDKTEGLAVAKKCLDLGASDSISIQLNVMEDKSIKDAVKKIMSLEKNYGRN